LFTEIFFVKGVAHAVVLSALFGLLIMLTLLTLLILSVLLWIVDIS
jgi:hypothetical protein